LQEWKNINIRGKLSGAPAKYAFTVDGKANDGDIGLNGGYDQGYKISLRLKKSEEIL